MKILWLSWKDAEHPDTGGAEVVKSQICKRLVRDGHSVIQLTGGFKDCEHSTEIDGCKIIRVGSRYTVYFAAWRYYKKHLSDWPDLVIDECNTIPFFARFYSKQANILFIHQLAREVWFYQMPWPISQIGYWLEPIYLRFLKASFVVTVSNSTKNELLSYGYTNENIRIIREGSDFPVLKHLDDITKKEKKTLLYLGSIRDMKRPDHVVKAFEYCKIQIPDLQLTIAGGGSGKYFDEFMALIENSPYKNDIEYKGRVTEQDKQLLMQEAHLIAVTSVKEGWGLIVTEAAGQGTPAVAYDVDGLRDSVRHESTGLLSQPSPKALSDVIIRLLSDTELYSRCQQNAWEWSQELTFDNCYKDFCDILEIE